MATKEQQLKFIVEIAPLAQKAYKELGKVLPSVCIAMACVECGYGTAGSCKHHSYIGQKVGTGRTATKYWSKGFFTSSTKEEYVVGVHTTIKSAFRSYDSMEQCVFNYYELLNSSLYKKVKAGVDYATQMQQIKDCGYMTSSTEVNSVKKIIKEFNLTQYDNGIPVAVTYPTLKKGTKNAYVTEVQKFLSILGYQVGNIDGIYGNQTESCVKQYQIDYNSKHADKILVDGIWGKQCWETVKGDK